MAMDNILPVQEGSNITLYNVIEYQPYRYGKRGDTQLFIVYRDENGTKHVQKIVKPEVEIYFVKPEDRTFMTPREYLEIDKVYPVKCPSNYILPTIREELNRYPDPVGFKLGATYDNARHLPNKSSKKEILKWPYTLMSDLNVETYYWIQLGYHYNTMHGNHVIDKCFADIENDVYGLTSAQQKANMDPVNACTVIFDYDGKGPNRHKKTQVYTFLLRNHARYPQQAYFEEHLDDFYAECHEKFDHQTVIKKGKKRVIDTIAEYHIELYDDERDLLSQIFGRINKEKPDVCEFWNMPYDMPKMKARMNLLGMDSNATMCDSTFFPKSVHFANFRMDERPIDISNRNSYIRMASTTQYVDQMQNYAGIRKGQKAYGSNSLDNIANIELGMGKWKFDKGIDVLNAAIKDYWNFVLYNIRDVWCQVLIDQVTNDTMAMVYDMNQMNCPLYHLTKQTMYQRYIYYCWYLRKGYVPGNNVNAKYTYTTEDDKAQAEEVEKRKRVRAYLDKQGMDADDINDIMYDDNAVQDVLDDMDDDVSENLEDAVAAIVSENPDIFLDDERRTIRLQGGAVGNPDFNIPNGEELIPGVRSKHVFPEIMDMDFSSEYPWAKFTRSLSRSTQYGRLIIPHKVSDMQYKLPLGQQKRKSDQKYYTNGGEFISDYLSGDFLMFSRCWFNLPGVEETEDLINKLILGESIGEDEKEEAVNTEEVMDAAVEQLTSSLPKDTKGDDTPPWI